MSDHYYEQKEKAVQFQSAERKCDECNRVFKARVHNQYKCDEPECIEDRRHQRTLAADHELKQAMRNSGLYRKNPIYPAPSDLMHIENSTF